MKSIILLIVFVVNVVMPGNIERPILDIPDQLIVDMAMTAKGESGVNPVDPACVMRNRIIAGWNPYKVLNHFYAPKINVSSSELDAVRNTIIFGEDCDPRAYFQWSLTDEANIRPNPTSFLYEKNGNVYYDYYALKRSARR